MALTTAQTLDELLAEATQNPPFGLPPISLLATSSTALLYSTPSPNKAPTSERILLGSQTKLITSLAALQLVDAGRLSLDADLRCTFPELKALPLLVGFDPTTDEPLLVENTTPITLQMMLSHTAVRVPSPFLSRWIGVGLSGTRRRALERHLDHPRRPSGRKRSAWRDSWTRRARVRPL